MTFFKKTIYDVPLDHETVLVRADYNIPLDSKGEISDDLRIKASIPTLQFLLERGCKIVVISHLGRPEGKDPKLSLEPVAARLAYLLQKNVLFVNDCKGDRVRQVVRRAHPGQIIMLENVRFYKEEEADDEAFAAAIAKDTGARYFVQDGFGVVHRAHASTHAITMKLPSVAGLLLKKEYTTITSALENPKRPLVAVMGGAKVSDKIKVIERFVDKADQIIIGGAMANTFLSYKGKEMGESKVESDQVATLNAIYHAVRQKTHAVDDFILLPVDVAVAPMINADQPRTERSVDRLEHSDIALDIASRSIDAMIERIESAGTVIWNGTLGYAELENFSYGSARLALALSENSETTSIIGGGDTADFVIKWSGGDLSSFTHVSTGGGASLELMAGDKLPGVESLLDAH